MERLVPISLEAAVPADDFYRHLDATLDLQCIREWVADCYAEGGRPSIDPVVFFKLQLVLFFEGLRSERQLMRVVADRLSLRWYLGYHLDEPLPDHASLTRIRRRLGLPLFERFFAHVVELCQQAGLVWGKELIVDATKVRANADIESLVPRWYAHAKAHLRALFDNDAEVEAGVVATGPSANLVEQRPAAAPPAGEAAAKRAVPRPLPFPGTLAEERHLAERNHAVWRLLDERRLDPTRPRSGSYQRITDSRVSRSDPDATPMSKGETATLGYQITTWSTAAKPGSSWPPWLHPAT